MVVSKADLASWLTEAFKQPFKIEITLENLGLSLKELIGQNSLGNLTLQPSSSDNQFQIRLPKEKSIKDYVDAILSNLPMTSLNVKPLDRKSIVTELASRFTIPSNTLPSIQMVPNEKELTISANDLQILFHFNFQYDSLQGKLIEGKTPFPTKFNQSVLTFLLDPKSIIQTFVFLPEDCATGNPISVEDYVKKQADSIADCKDIFSAAKNCFSAILSSLQPTGNVRVSWPKIIKELYLYSCLRSGNNIRLEKGPFSGSFYDTLRNCSDLKDNIVNFDRIFVSFGTFQMLECVSNESILVQFIKNLMKNHRLPIVSTFEECLKDLIKFAQRNVCEEEKPKYDLLKPDLAHYKFKFASFMDLTELVNERLKINALVIDSSEITIPFNSIFQETEDDLRCPKFPCILGSTASSAEVVKDYIEYVMQPEGFGAIIDFGNPKEVVLQQFNEQFFGETSLSNYRKHLETKIVEEDNLPSDNNGRETNCSDSNIPATNNQIESDSLVDANAPIKTFCSFSVSPNISEATGALTEISNRNCTNELNDPKQSLPSSSAIKNNCNNYETKNKCRPKPVTSRESTPNRTNVFLVWVFLLGMFLFFMLVIVCFRLTSESHNFYENVII